jgi:acyl-CoA synthetase (NDP forming)
MSIGHDSMRFFFEPRSIAVISASRDRGKIGSAVLRNFLKKT